MAQPATRHQHTYHLVLHEDGRGLAQTVELRARASDAALFFAEEHCVGRELELFEDGRKLARMKLSRQGGFWRILN